MCRKQLYHYFDEAPSVAAAWQLVEQRKSRRSESSDATQKRRIRLLEEELEAWKAVATEDGGVQSSRRSTFRRASHRCRSGPCLRCGRRPVSTASKASSPNAPRSSYQPGVRSRSWVRRKHWRVSDLLVIGYADTGERGPKLFTTLPRTGGVGIVEMGVGDAVLDGVRWQDGVRRRGVVWLVDPQVTVAVRHHGDPARPRDAQCVQLTRQQATLLSQ